MKSFGQKSWMLPQPVLIIGTYDKNGKPNAMNRWSSESISQTRLDYAESRQRKAKPMLLGAVNGTQRRL